MQKSAHGEGTGLILWKLKEFFGGYDLHTKHSDVCAVVLHQGLENGPVNI